MRAETIKGHLDLLLLAVVGRGAVHGYAIITELTARSGGALNLPEGTVYPALHRLEAAGLLESEWAPSGGRRRRVYRLTGAGRAALAQRRADWRDFAAAVGAVLAGAGATIETQGNPA
jgi:DNA-binding PadR family transcriptional regulator